MYSEYVYTTADYLRDVSVINPEWVFQASPTYFQEELFPDTNMRRALFRIKRLMEKREKSNPL